MERGDYFYERINCSSMHVFSEFRRFLTSHSVPKLNDHKLMIIELKTKYTIIHSASIKFSDWSHKSQLKQDILLLFDVLFGVLSLHYNTLVTSIQ